MDVSYTNVLEGARQYFQGLPMPSTAITPTKNRIHDEQTSNSSTVDDGRQTNSNNINKIYWNTSNNELRTIEPYPPQPTRVEVPDTRPNNDDNDDNNDDNNKRSEYLENHKNLTNLTEMQSTNRTNKLNQQRDLLNTHSPSPIYQQLNNVSGPSSYNRPIEINNTTTNNSSYTTNDRTTSTPVIPHRTQYYPRYHHPDITKSSPLPFSRNTNVYQASVSPSIDSQPQPSRQLINIDLENKRIQDQQQQQLPPSSVYQMTSSETTASPTVAYRQSSSSSDSSSIHSSTNPCNPCHVQKIHIPSHNNHQGYIPSPHLPVSSVAPQSSIAHPSSQLSHLTNRINSTNNNNNINNQSRVGLSSSSHYQNQHHHASKQQQQQSMLPPSMCNNQLSISSHESNRNLNSPSRQSPHASILHNPIASQGLIDAQPHSPPYPPPPHSPPRVSSHHSMHSSSSSSSSSSSTTYGSHNAHSSSYPQNSYQTNIYHSTTKINNQYPVNDLQSSSSSTLNSNTSVYSRQHASPLKQNNNYNIIDSKQIAGISNANQGNTSSSVYIASAGIQRSINTHNLPINDNSSGHLNRSNRDIQIKNQSISQLSNNNNMTSSSSSYVLAPRTREHSHERISNAINAETYYPPYKSSEYRDYKTTNASSHYSCTSSTSTTVMSVSNDTRPSAPSSITVPLRPVLDTNNRRLIYPQQQQQQHRRGGGDDYSSTDYLYNNSNSTNQRSQSQPTSRVVSPQPFIVNGPVIKKRESPLDLSVKTIKTTADSTARDDIDTFDRTNNLRKNIMPLLSTHQGPVVYANYDNRQLNGSRYSTPNLRPTTPQVPVCAPKVDFLPNFNSTPLRHQNNNNTDNNLRRSTPNILPTQAQTNNLQSLPNMSTFKKTLLPTTATTTTTTTTTSSSSSSSQPGTNNYHVLPERVKLPSKYPTVEPRQQQQRLQDYDNNDRYSESHNKYITNRGSVKRLGGPYIPGGIGPNKHPRVDVWKEVFDKQIQDKLTAALAQREQQQKQNLEKNLPKTTANGTLVSSIYQNTNTNNNLQQQNTENSSFHSQSINQYQRMNINEERYKDINNCRDTNVYPIIKSPSLASGLHTSSQSSYSHQSNSRSPHPQQQQQPPPPPPPQQQQQQQQWQSFHDLPSNTGADKRVLTLLRNSLENKQQREEQLNNKQSIYSNKIITPVEPKTNIGRHNLSPFAAASLLERNSNTSPHHKFHVPRTIDSITQEMSRSPYGSRIINSASLPIGKEADINNRNIELQRDNKDDNLAAILAAKIRTKAELKQVVSGQYNCSKTISLLSSSSSSSLSLQDIGDSERAASTSTPQSAASSAGSPPKLTREKTPSILPRRRLFSKSEDDNNTTLMSTTTTTTTTTTTITSSTKAAPIVPQFIVPTRSSDFRSSSETSVFDFRESDSEGEMPVLERQTLEEMRRDRKQLSKVQPAVSFNDAMSVNMITSTDLVKIELKENNQVNKNDPFWSETCDKFMEQLRSGGSSGSSGGSGDSAKKRGRRKKIIHTKIDNNNIKTEIIIKPENIKKEINEKLEIEINNDNNIKLELIKNTDDDDNDNNEIIIKNEITNDINDNCNNSDHDSDELPLIKRASRRRIKKEINDSDADDDIISKKRRGSRIKLESSSGSESSSDDSDASGEPGLGSSVAHRLRTRKRSGITTIIDNEGMKLRSREMLPQKIKQQQQQQQSKETKETKETKTPIKNTIIQKPKPKPLFGDGSDFRPGWEEEVYVYKKSLRMPTQLINVSRPSRFHRLSTSLPDLDPDSPALSVSMDSTDVCLEKRGGGGVNSSGISAIGRVADSDIDSNCSLPNNDDEGTSTPIITTTTKTTTTNLSNNQKSIIKFDGNSIVDVLAKKVGSNKKDLRKKLKDKFEKNSIKILPKGSNEPELLSTPSFTKIINETKLSTTNGKSQIKNNSNNNNNNNNSNNNKFKKSVNMVDSLLGYFRKETVNNFRDTFKNNHALPNEFSTYVLKSRTRTETKVLKKQATIREVFGEDRPASAPPMQNHAGDTSQDDDDDDDSQTETKEILKNKNNSRTLRQKVVSRLKNVGIIRSHKSIINSKRHLLTVQRRKVILKSMTDKKLKNSINNENNDDVEDEDENENNDEIIKQENNKIKKEQDTDINDDTEIVGKKKIKLRNGRKKFRSGFDYIRKKKKPIKKDDNNIPKERKKQMNLRTNAECVADLQNEIRTWVIKKGVGETILHRAARLGYTDVAAYCLEKLNNAPSPKDNAGYTPLHEACSRGHLEIAKLLLAYGANVSESANGGIRPLHEAAENGATELVRLLLSYGADPLLATYAGHTPLMLAVDTDAYTILEQHLGDVQGRSTTPWKFYGPSSIFDPEDSGYNPMKEPPVSSPEPELDDIEFEMSDINLPVLFSLANDPDKWILLSDLMSALRIKSRDALLRQINPKAPPGPPTIAHRDVMKELKLPDFLDQSRCCHLLSAGEKINVRASKVALIKYNEQVKSLLNVESVFINLS